MFRYKAETEYCGTNLVGWQKQDKGLSVQACLENALFNLTGENIEVFGAGRTDAGVHALHQTIHFDCSKDIDSYHFREGINAHLRELEYPVSIVEIDKTNADFHARFSAIGKEYIYKILNRRASSPIYNNLAWHISYPLDVEKMRQASVFLVGNHDFTSFRATACQAKSPIKTLDKIDIKAEGDFIVFYFYARSFLHHQVRNMVGTLKMVGDGHLEPISVKHILDKKNRASAGPTAPARGLYLSKVFY